MENKKIKLKELQEKIKALQHGREINKLMKERDKLDKEIEIEENKNLVGKCFMYENNSYSCPSKKSDYWNVYYKVVAMKGDNLIVLICQKDSYGDIDINQKEEYSFSLAHYKAISRKRFDNELKKLKKIIEELE